MQCTIYLDRPGVKPVRSISGQLVACFLLCLGAQGAFGADDNAPAEAAVPAPPPAVEVIMPAGAVEWTWIVPASYVPAGADADAGAEGVGDGAGDGDGDGEAEGERLTDTPPQGVSPLRLGTIRFHYQGDAPAPVRIVGTVPADLEYIEGSATGPGAEVEYDAAARELSWTIAGPLDPGTRGLVSFRAVPADAPDPEATETP